MTDLAEIMATIETDIPMPPERRRMIKKPPRVPTPSGSLVELLQAMAVGNSADITELNRDSVKMVGWRMKDRKFTIRRSPRGVYPITYRVWRIA
jgi:hypothetical protein